MKSAWRVPWRLAHTPKLSAVHRNKWKTPPKWRWNTIGANLRPCRGLVQIPCIERNGIAAEKALKLATLALLEDGTDKKVSLDEVIQTMLQTGRDMKATYKETSLAGLAITLQKKAIPVSVRVVEC